MGGGNNLLGGLNLNNSIHLAPVSELDSERFQ